MVQEVIERDKNPKKDSQSDRYSTAQKQKAVVLYRMLGSFALIEEMTGIHHETLRRWKGSDWWKELEADIISQSKAELTGNLKKIVNKAFVQLEDRLENGDYIFDQKTGEMRRKPVGAHTVNQILQTGLDKQFLMDKLQRDQKVLETQDSIDLRLKRLGEEFQRFANAKDVTNAVHDGRTPGLLEGIQALSEPTGGPEADHGEARSSGSHDEEGAGSQGGQQAGGPYPPAIEGGINGGQ